MDFLTVFVSTDDLAQITWRWLVVIAIAYFIGNISPAIILGKLHGVDIKKEGSGNAGTTNVLRVLGKRAALTTLFIDILKGYFAVKLGFFFGGYAAGTLCALAVFCGHIWPCLYHFKGGKGVATAFGAVFAINWQLALALLALAAAGVAVSRRMSVGSLLAAAGFVVLCRFMEPDFWYVGIVMALIVIVKHRANLVRLFRGEEPKMSFKK